MAWLIYKKDRVLSDVEGDQSVFSTDILLDKSRITHLGHKFYLYPGEEEIDGYHTILRGSSGISLEHRTDPRIGASSESYEDIAMYASNRLPSISDELTVDMMAIANSPDLFEADWAKAVIEAGDMKKQLDNLQSNIIRTFCMAYLNGISLNRNFLEQNKKSLSSLLDPLISTQTWTL